MQIDCLLTEKVQWSLFQAFRRSHDMNIFHETAGRLVAHAQSLYAYFGNAVHDLQN